MAQNARDTALLLSTHNVMGCTLYFLGAFALALAHLQQGIELYDPRQHANPQMTRSVRNSGESCLSHAAFCLVALGYQDQARQRIQEALSLSQELAHPYSRAYALLYRIMIHESHRGVQSAHERADELLAPVTAHGFSSLMGHALFWRGWTLAMQGREDEGLGLMLQGVGDIESTGAKVGRTVYLGCLADAYGNAGQIDAGLRVLAEVRPGTDDHWAAELYRRQGELLLMAGEPRGEEAEACLQRALTITRHQQAKWWELRTPRAWPVCGNPRASVRKPTTCWCRCMGGSPRDLTRRICRRYEHCSMR
jgi:predicted ATPase